MLVTDDRAKIIHLDHDRVHPGHRCVGVGGIVGVRDRVKLPAGAAGVGLARCGAVEVLGDGGVVAGVVVEAAGDGGGVAVGGVVLVVEAVPNVGEWDERHEKVRRYRSEISEGWGEGKKKQGPKER